MVKPLYLTYLLSILLALLAFCCPAQVGVKGYYHANGTYVQPHVRSSPDDAKPDRLAINSGGSYALKYSVESTVTKYYLYNSNQTIYGKMFFFNDGDMCIYDMSGNLLKSSPNTFPNDIDIRHKRAHKGGKIIIGNTGDYGIEYSNDGNVNKFYLYHSDNTKYGKVFFFNDGDMCTYDLNDNLISGAKFK